VHILSHEMDNGWLGENISPLLRIFQWWRQNYSSDATWAWQMLCFITVCLLCVISSCKSLLFQTTWGCSMRGQSTERNFSRCTGPWHSAKMGPTVRPKSMQVLCRWLIWLSYNLLHFSPWSELISMQWIAWHLCIVYVDHVMSDDRLIWPSVGRTVCNIG